MTRFALGAGLALAIGCTMPPRVHDYPDVVVPEVDAGTDAPIRRPPRISIEPIDLIAEAELDEVVTADFTVYHYDGLGARTAVPASEVTFEIDDPRLGTIDGSGHFASGPRSTGTAQLTATYGTLQAYAPIEITRLDRILVGGATAADASRFGALVTSEEMEALVVYPLDGVVMPQDAYRPEIQWERGGTGDVYRIRIRQTHSTIDVYVRETGTQRRAWLVDDSLWRLIVQTDVGESFTLRVDRFDAVAGVAIEGTPITMRIVPGVLDGMLYYWAASREKLVRVRHGTNVREDFADASTCVGCHVVAHDGRTMAARLGPGDGNGGFYDTSATPLASARRAPARWYFSSFAPSDDRLIVDTASMALELVDVASGSFVTSASSMLPRSASANPSWSPDGSTIAFVSNIDRNYRPGSDSFHDGDLAILPVTGPDTFGPPTTVVYADSIPSPIPIPYRCIDQPTWAPDSRMIVFSVGPYSGTAWPHALYATHIEAGAATSPIRLDRAMGNVPGAPFTDVSRDGCTWPDPTYDCCHDVYHGAYSVEDSVCAVSETDRDGSPRFAPFYQGGYFWLAFSSRRAYGNTIAGTPRPGAIGAGRPQAPSQIWIAAIDPSAEFDPSFAPYWVSGQDPQSSNIDAQWSPVPCSTRGESCAVDGECCSGVCSATSECVPPPPDRCHTVSETCSEDGDCCGSLVCIGRLCSSEVI
jgi:hypothetical protein